MKAQSRLGVSGGGGMSASEDEHEAVIRELTRGRQLTARLRAEALRALRGQGQAEATAALILQEVSRAFTVCLNIMGSPASAPPQPEMPGVDAAAAAPFSLAPPRRNREDSIPREQTVTPSPHYDGYQWRKYGQKRITKTHYPRCYYRCSFHRERGCRATKQVQQCSGGDQPQYLVMYFNDHTCDTAAWEPEAAAGASAAMQLDLPGAGLVAPRRGGLLDERGVQEEHERQVLVSSLACVLGAQQQFHHQSPPAAAGSSAAVAVNVAQAAGPAPVVDAAAGMPRLDVDVVGLDVMDYDDVPGELCFGDSYGLPGGGGGLPF
ncbi:putative WRKY transcription factor 4 [Panicum miliaceum]|uniref:WRKY transcription factor 4 n=1 Tax=Panicum miliaceum TaxID=4540 RepID=A0A3L6R2X7_PANMI|nr:putative WRKY transcription factor 4 [Panicum miliaceum]